MHRSGQDENWLIRKIRRDLASGAAGELPRLKVGIGDDAALWRPSPGQEVVLTCDWFLEAVHFRRDTHPADAVGWKCLARAVSDIAAMGARPRCFLLSLALPESHTGEWLDSFLAGLRRASRKFRCPPAGGDTTRSEKILINVTAIGEVRKAALRSGARVDDLICVSGRLGEAQLGLELLLRRRSTAGQNRQALEKHLYPRPRLEQARQLVESGFVTAMIDLSDGLSTDLKRLCRASGVGATIQQSRLPLAKPLAQQTVRHEELLRAALHGGDDYELLFTVPRRNLKRLPRKIAGVLLTVIGQVQKGNQIFLAPPNGRRVPLRIAGWDPFRRTTKNSQKFASQNGSG